MVLLASCAIDVSSLDASLNQAAIDAFNDDFDNEPSSAIRDAVDEEAVDEEAVNDEPANDEAANGETLDGDADRGSRSLATAGIDPSLTRSDNLCVDPDDDEIGSDRFTYEIAYQVVEGNLGAPCFGEADELLEETWRMLAELTPPDQLRDLALFGGFRTRGDTLAFVASADRGLGSLYEMSINLAAARNDRDELSLTLAHEFSHVFTATPGELDRETDERDCSTFGTIEGCYLPNSIIATWVSEFWPSHIAGYDADENPEDDVVQRCAIDPGFFGSYGATNPEEDFAEAFAAYVLRVPAEGPSQQLRLDWIDDQPGLREFRDRAAEFGYGPLRSTFDECGFDSDAE